MGAWGLQSRTMVMSEHEQTDTSPQQKDWEAQLIRDLGRWTRRVREFLGYSQDKLAKLADVSQGAVSRVEAGRGKATPLLTFTKINQVFAKALSEIDSSMLTTEAQAMLERARHMAQPVSPVPGLMLVDPILERMINTYHTLPQRERQGFVTVLDATATSLSRHPAPLTADNPAERAARIGH
jgi:DNA-binding XRE family transcriptional regulator